MSSDLVQAAADARKHAYAPYSGYFVGAAVRGEDGKIRSGCNCENVSYGVTLCAERVAIGKLVSEGLREVRELALVTKDGGTPCGICLQTLLEFVRDPASVSIHCVDEQGQTQTYTLRQLIPHGFHSSEVAKS